MAQVPILPEVAQLVPVLAERTGKTVSIETVSQAERLANLGHGGNRTKRPIGLLTTQKDAADKLKVSERSVKRARKVHQKGIPELAQAVERGDMPVSKAAILAGAPKEVQKHV